jgi:hypothetical protein
MAYEIGTASDHADFWDKLIAFLTTNEELVYDGQNWDVVWQAPTGAPNDTDIVLRGPGLAFQDQVYVAMRRVDNVPNDASEIRLRGATGVIASAQEYFMHVNVTPQNVRMFLRAHPMEYWFVSNGRRFVAVAKVGTVYEAMYAGLFLPYAEPQEYSYPLFVGACAGAGGPTAAEDWRSTRDDHSNFILPSYSTVPSTGWNPSAWLLGPNGSWLRCSADNSSSDVYMGPDLFGQGMGIAKGFSSQNYGYGSIKLRMVQAYGGGFVLTPITMTQASPSDQTYGVLDGCFHVPGRGNSVENTIEHDGVTHVVFQNTFRTDLGQWWALALGVL